MIAARALGRALVEPCAFVRSRAHVFQKSRVAVAFPVPVGPLPFSLATSQSFFSWLPRNFDASRGVRMWLAEIAKFPFCPRRSVNVARPSTSPAEFTIGPPLFPGEIGADV